MSTSLVSRYKKLVVQHVEAQEQEARAKSRYESAIADRKKIEHEMAEVEAALEFGESLMATAPGSAAPAPKISNDVDDGDDTNGPRKSTRDLVLLIPRDGEATRADFASLGLNVGALNARLMDAKNRGYIEMADVRGHYRLTDKGKAVHGVRLKVVPSGGS